MLEPGYFIDNEGNKTSCLISNQTWVDSPTSFKYLKNTQTNLVEVKIEDVQEFGIINNSKFVRLTVAKQKAELDKKGSKEEHQKFSSEYIFLRELVRGEFNLYSYTIDGENTFYFRRDDGIIKILSNEVLNQGEIESVNSSFRIQLSENVNCKKKSKKFFTNLKYDQRALIDYFIEQNQCSKQEYFSEYEIKTVPGKTQVNLKSGVLFSSLNVDNTRGRVYDSDFGDFIVPTYGVEFEYSLSENQKSWSLLTELMYERFNESSTIEFRIRNHRDESYANYSALNLTLNLRRYLSISKKSKLFANVGALFSFPFDSFVELEETELFEINSQVRFGAGIGFSYSDKIYLEARQYNDINWSDNFTYRVEYSSGMVMLSYRIFQSKKF